KMSVRRTERIWVKNSITLMQLAHRAKNLYNQANYVMKYQWRKNNYLTNEFELMGMLRYHPTFTCLPVHTAQQTIKFLYKEWKGYLRALKEWKKNPKKFKGQPRPPKYKRKGGVHILYFTNYQVKLKRGYLSFPKLVGLKVTTRLEKVKIKFARLIPKGTAFLLEIVYEKDIPETTKEVKHILALDLGVNNLVTGVSNVKGTKPFLINGRPLKSFNQWFNKRRSHLQSAYKHQKLDFKGQKLLQLQHKRFCKIEDYMHKTSRLVINYCLEHNIDTIVIGYNPGWKQKSKMSKKNNQTFISIPFLTLVKKIQYKALDEGIKVKLVSESYTSLCSFLDDEPLFSLTLTVTLQVISVVKYSRCCLTTGQWML
ncbi:MAG: RNA-guided endonuclease InsQ/TnpB family protein, partial [Candidatus Heimdallarchaeaceae archaeon]